MVDTQGAVGCEVLVLGAGPTGLSAALDLTRRGIDVRIVDPAFSAPMRSPSRGLGPRSLEIFDDLGVVDELLRFGSLGQGLRMYAGRREVAHLPAGSDRTSRRRAGRRYSRSLAIATRQVERVLRESLAAGGVKVEVGLDVRAWEQDDSGVTVRMTPVDGGSGELRVRAAYLVLADVPATILPAAGATSTATTPGTTTQTTANGSASYGPAVYVGEVRVDGLPREDTLHVWTEGIMLAPLPAEDTWWFRADGVPDASHRAPTLTQCQELFRQRTGRDDVRIVGTQFLTAYPARYDADLGSASYRQGRVFLTGDAVGDRSLPRGADAGIQDAYNLGWKLAAAIRAGEDVVLDSYEPERQAHEAGPSGSGPSASYPRHRPRLPLSARRWGRRWYAELGGQGQLDLHYRGSGLSQELGGKRVLLRAGDRVPDIRLWSVRAAREIRLFEILRGTHWTVLGLGSVAAEPVAAVVRRFGSGVHGEVIGGGSVGSAIPGVTLLDSHGEARHTLGSRGGSVLLVRPDGYLGLRAGGRPEVIAAYLEGMVAEEL